MTKPLKCCMNLRTQINFSKTFLQIELADFLLADWIFLFKKTTQRYYSASSTLEMINKLLAYEVTS